MVTFGAVTSPPSAFVGNFGVEETVPEVGCIFSVFAIGLLAVGCVTVATGGLVAGGLVAGGLVAGGLVMAEEDGTFFCSTSVFRAFIVSGSRSNLRSSLLVLVSEGSVGVSLGGRKGGMEGGKVERNEEE